MSLIRIAALAVCGLTAIVCTGCGAQGVKAGAEPATSPGCGDDIAPIVEPTAFTPYSARLTVMGVPDTLGMSPLSRGETPPTTLPGTLDGRKATGYVEDADSVAAAYGGPKLDPETTYRDYISEGGLLLSATSDGEGADMAATLKNGDGGDRVTMVRVGDHDAALTWADPFENGVREHNVIWTVNGTTYKVEAVLSAEKLLAVARGFACR